MGEAGRQEDNTQASAIAAQRSTQQILVSSDGDWEHVTHESHVAVRRGPMHMDEASPHGPASSLEAPTLAASNDDRHLEDKVQTVVMLTNDQINAVNACFQALHDATAKIAPLRARILLKRDEAVYEVSDLSHRTRHIEESQQLVKEALVPNDTSTRSAPLDAGLDSKFSNLLQDYSSLDSQAKKFHGIESELGRLEYKVKAEEERLEQASRSLHEVLEQLGIAPRLSFPSWMKEEMSAHGSVAQSSTSTDIHPLIADYNDKLGTYKVMKERLTTLQDEHEDARVTRSFEADQEKVPEMPDDDFENLYLLQRAEQIDAIDAAGAAAEAARAACIGANLDLDSDQRRSPVAMVEATHDLVGTKTSNIKDTQLSTEIGIPQTFTSSTDVFASANDNGASIQLATARSWPTIHPTSTSRDITPRSALVQDWIQNIDNDREDSDIEELIERQVNHPPGVDSPPSDGSLIQGQHRRIRTLENTPIPATPLPRLSRSNSTGSYHSLKQPLHPSFSGTVLQPTSLHEHSSNEHPSNI